MQLRRLFTVVVTLLILSACVSVQTTKSGAIGLDRDQSMSLLVSEEELEQGAIASYAQIIGEAKEGGNLNTNSGMTTRVRTIADRIIPTVGTFREDALDWNWEVNVIQSDQLNAWAMPGGKIAFYSGIIEQLQLTDSEIAAIMGHEISHALREHSRERASEQANKTVVLQIISAATSAGETAQSVADTVYTYLRGLPNSRLHETEADRMGVELMARAGYDPRAAISVWEKMAQASGGQSTPEFLSTHPSNETRIKDLTDYSARVLPLYQSAQPS